jgi:hypothetical protein
MRTAMINIYRALDRDRGLGGRSRIGASVSLQLVRDDCLLLFGVSLNQNYPQHVIPRKVNTENRDLLDMAP